MEKVNEMSPANKITIFPEGRTAETVLAVDLDDETREYLNTYPGSAQWLDVSAAEELAGSLGETQRRVKEIPGLELALLNKPANIKELLMLYSRMWNILAAIVGFALGIAVARVDGAAGASPTLMGCVCGFGTMYFSGTYLQKKRREHREHDETLKQTYAERLQAAAPHLVSIDAAQGDQRVRDALSYAETIHKGLTHLRQSGLSTVEEAEATDAALGRLLSAHVDESTAKTTLEPYRKILEDAAHDSDDEDIQYVQDLCTKQSRLHQKANDTIRAALEELSELETEVTAAERATHAKLAAARIRSEDGLDS